MIEVRQTTEFAAWLASLRDSKARARIAQRLLRVALGNLGDAEPVGEGVSELRVHYGPGYRLYALRRGREVIILLCGGDKSSQERDIGGPKRSQRSCDDGGRNDPLRRIDLPDRRRVH